MGGGRGSCRTRHEARYARGLPRWRLPFPSLSGRATGCLCVLIPGCRAVYHAVVVVGTWGNWCILIRLQPTIPAYVQSGGRLGARSFRWHNTCRVHAAHQQRPLETNSLEAEVGCVRTPTGAWPHRPPCAALGRAVQWGRVHATRMMHLRRLRYRHEPLDPRSPYPPPLSVGDPKPPAPGFCVSPSDVQGSPLQTHSLEMTEREAFRQRWRAARATL